MTERNMTDRPKSPEPKPMRRKKKFRRKSDRTLILKLALTNAREERERSEMMNELMDCDQDFEPDYDELMDCDQDFEPDYDEFNFKRPKKELSLRLCDRCEFLYGVDYKNCDCKDLISGYFTSS